MNDAGEGPQRAHAPRFSRAEVLAAAAVSLVALVAYVLTLYPDVAGGDSGELVAAVATGGVIHPPGYPLYSLLGRLVVHIPHGTIAWRANLLSAACDASAAGLLSLAVARRARSWGGGVVAGALFAFAPGIWSYAICAEVFALNNLFVALLLLLAVLYGESRDRRYAWGGAFVVGLGLSNHHTLALVAVPLAAWMLRAGRADLLRPRVVLRLACLFALGLLPYVALPLEARVRSPVSWGAAGTWPGFWTHVLRREYGTFHMAVPGLAATSSAGELLAAFGRDLLDQIGWAGVILAVVGLASCLRSPRATHGFSVAVCAPPVLSVAVIAGLGNLPVADALHRGIVARFWQQPEVFAFAWCGCGFAVVARLAANSVQERARAYFPAVTAAAAVGAGLLAFSLRARAMDHHRSTVVRSYGAEILRAAPPGALLVTRGDLMTNTVRYLQAAEGLRPDVRVVDQELLGFTWGRDRFADLYPDVVLPGPRYMPGADDSFTLAQMYAANLPRAPVLVCGGLKPGDGSADATYGRWPFGLCEAVHPGTEPVNVETWLAESDAALPRIDFTGQAHPPGSWEDVVYGDMWEVRQARAAHLLALAGHDAARHGLILLAAGILQALVEENPDLPAHVYRNLAVALGRSGRDGPDTPAQRRSAADAWRRYLELSPADAPDRAPIMGELRRLSALSDAADVGPGK